MPRFHVRRVGTNESWLSVYGAPSGDVVSAIIASYTARGATLQGRARDASLERGHPEKKAARLGVAVTAPKKGWVQVVDSFGYTSDLTLARDLAKALDATVFRESITDAADHAATERFGPVRAPSALPEMPLGYQDDDGAKTTWLVFGGVTRARYDLDAAIQFGVTCETCGRELPWIPGFELPCVPTPKNLYRLGAKKKVDSPPEGKLLFRMHCNDCREALGWASADIALGVVSAVTRLDAAPATREGFDFALERQRESIEAALPSKATLAVNDFTARFAEEPRKALTAALAKVLPTSKTPPAVTLLFAPTREALIAAYAEAFPKTAWQEKDLYGRVELQITIWIGPDKKVAPALVRFLDACKPLLAPGSFAREGADRKTKQETVAVCFPVPDGTWAALCLRDKLRTIKG